MATFITTQLTTAYAHDVVERGKQAYNEARFEDSLSAFEEAEGGNDLALDDLVQLLESKALVLSALERSSEAEECIKDLAALKPDHTLTASVPPELAEVFAQTATGVAGSTKVEMSLSTDGNTVTAKAVVIQNARIIRKLVVYQRADDGAWEQAEDSRSMSATQYVDSYAEAIAAGGVVLARAYSKSSPQRSEVAAQGVETDFEPESKRSLNVGALVSFSVAAVGLAVFGTTAIMALSARSDLDDRGCRQTMCPVEDIERLDRLALLSDIGLGIAAAGAVAGVLFLLLRRPKRKDSKVSLVPSFGPGFFGLSGDATF